MGEPTKPRWFEIGGQLLWPTLELAYVKMRERSGSPLHLNVIPQMAAAHLIHCLDTSSKTNRLGQHAVSLSLLRQCVEAITVVELGLLPVSYGDPLLSQWRGGKLSAGAARKHLESDRWPSYGKGLWDETWAEFFGELARAVQPYSHYGWELQGWQLAAESEKLHAGPDDNYFFLGRFGLKTYDAFKATRVTLLHMLIGWTVSQLILRNDGDDRIDVRLSRELGKEIANSDLLGKGQLEWHQEFWPFMFERPDSGFA